VFDLRYHVASLVAVFLALVIGIVVGVGISGRGFVSDSERSLFEARIADLEGRLESATRRTGELARAQQASRVFIEDTYPALMAERLRDRHVALVFVGPVDGRVQTLVERALADADGPPPLRLHSIKVPIDPKPLRTTLATRQVLAAYAGERRLSELGRRLGADLVAGGASPAWDALAEQLVAERSGDATAAADGVVLVRTVPPQQGATSRFVQGFYAGLVSAGVPVVGVETLRTRESAIPAFARAELSTVDDVDTEAGRLALAVVLAGGRPGHYGLKTTAEDGVLPPVERVGRG
jgi:hypothetical protein